MNLIGKKFGKLTVISKADNIEGGKSIKRFYGAWNCHCDCGNFTVIKTYHLNRGSIKSCGCLNKYTPKNNYKSGDKFNKLTLLNYEHGEWECLCECNNKIWVKTDKITSGNTKSCGCLKTEKSSKNVINAISKRKKFTPEIASARRIWKSYNYKNINNNITFNEFIKLAKMNCYYCDNPPSISYNHFTSKYSNGSDLAKNTGTFIYNELNLIDSAKPYTINNVVTYCSICKIVKGYKTTKEFYDYINSVNINDKYSIFNFYKNCNFTKVNLSINNFYNWINKIKVYQKEKAGI